jgi:hypothetical protein
MPISTRSSLAAIRREPDMDFQTAVAAGLAGAADREVLARAAAEGRLLVTHDRKTMPRHFGNFVAQETSPGLLIVPQSLPIATVVEELILVWSLTEADDWLNRLCVLPL